MTKNQKIAATILIVVIVAIAIFAAVFYYQNLRGIWPVFSAPAKPITEQIYENPLALKLPAGFQLSVFASGLAGARVLALDRSGNIWVSQTSQGTISKLQIENGQLKLQSVVFSGLKNPHGLAFDPASPDDLYIAEETKISKVNIAPGSDLKLQKIIDLPKGGRHFTRTLQFGPDSRLFVSIGSSCDVCREPDGRFAAIYSLNKDGSGWQPVAKGLRNSVFFIFNQADNKIWATEMGRDLLGDNLPPDEINVIDPNAATPTDYGWPICYGQNIHDTKFDKNTYIRNPCMAPFTEPSRIDLQAHSAPLGLAFVPKNSAWPAEFQNNLIVAFHGSWNRSVSTGYKVVRLVLDQNNNFVRQEDFITGWLTDQGASGRPAAVIFDPSGNMFVSDDKAGVVYKVVYKK